MRERVITKSGLGSSWETLVFGQRESRLSLIVNSWERKGIKRR
jgi:hypothetical protein